MRFLLFLVLVLMQYNYCSAACKEGQVLSPNAASCDDDAFCESYTYKDGSKEKNYEFKKGAVKCVKEDEGSPGVCCFEKSYCNIDNENSDLLISMDNGKELPVMCTEHDECEEMRNKMNEKKPFACTRNLCCSKEVVSTEIECPLNEGEKPSPASCTSGDKCSDDRYCGQYGCCKVGTCEGSHMLPQHNISITKYLSFLSCTNNQMCSDKNFPDTYCSKLSNGSPKKFCCPVPYSKKFIEVDPDSPRYLLQTNVLKFHDMIDKPAEIARALEGEERNFSKKCSTNSDCGKDEFCDEVVPRSVSEYKTVSEMAKIRPKACFPSPRCHGIAVKDPNDIGISLGCDTGERPCGQTDFCDTQANRGTDEKYPSALHSLSICCHYDCKADAIATNRIADATTKAWASFTQGKATCTSHGHCGDNGLCIQAKDVINETNNLLPAPGGLGLCFQARKEEELYRCLIDSPLRDVNNKIMKCNTDEDCNREEGKAIGDRSNWKYECVKSESNEMHCCRAPHCDDGITFMRTELDCKTPQDCMKDEEDKSNAVGRAVCADFTERNQPAKKKKCCPISNEDNRLAYCTKRNCSSLTDCDTLLAYCHPTKRVCCHVGVKRLDGTKHEVSGTCQGTCPDREIFSKKIAQYCVSVRSGSSGEGACYLSPYVKIVDRVRTVNPVYKTVFIVSVVLTLVFAFLAVIMFVNYRSRNFCDKYTPKKKKGKGKKRKESSKKSEGTEGGGTSGVSGTSGADGGTSGGTSGTSGAGDGTSGVGATSGAGDGTSGTSGA